MTHHFLIYLLSVLTINLLPGPDMFYTISQSVQHGKRQGLAAALGIGSGCFVHIFAVSAGLSALIFRSALAFSIIKYVGVCYLLYLGLTSLMKKHAVLLDTQQGARAKVSWRKIYFQGFFINVMNPKVALFFLAFLPQFVVFTSSYPVGIQLLILGLIFNCSGTIVNILVAYFFGSLKQWLADHPIALIIQQKMTGIVLIVFGLRLATFQKI